MLDTLTKLSITLSNINELEKDNNISDETKIVARHLASILYECFELIRDQEDLIANLRNDITNLIGQVERKGE